MSETTLNIIPTPTLPPSGGLGLIQNNGAAPIVEPSPLHNPSGGFSLHVNVDGTQGAIFNDIIPLVAGQRYYLRCDVFATGQTGGSTATFRVRHVSPPNNGVTVLSLQTALNNTAVILEGEFVSLQDDLADVMMVGGGSGDGNFADIYYDRMMLTPIDAPGQRPSYVDGSLPGAEWLGTEYRSQSRFPAVVPEVLLPGGEILAAQRSFPDSQRLLVSGLERRLGSLIPVGWYGTETHPLSGAFALARRAGPYADLVGEVLLVRRAGTERQAYVYVVGERDVQEDLALYRRAFAELGGLWLESADCVIEVCQ